MRDVHNRYSCCAQAEEVQSRCSSSANGVSSEETTTTDKSTRILVHCLWCTRYQVGHTRTSATPLWREVSLRYQLTKPASSCLQTTTITSTMASTEKKKPVTIITIGMAGAGKSTFVQRMNSHLHSQNPPSPPYILNLDPAVAHLPFDANIDIRDTVNYPEVMKQYVSLLSGLESVLNAAGTI